MSKDQLDSVLVSVHNGVGRLSLNRPRQINALSHPMVGLLQDALDRWRADPEVRVVVLTGEGERGFCAGGDIRAIYDDARAGTDTSLEFWAHEYRLNATLATYPKPVVAFMAGIVMGGGVGLAVHASHRVVREDSVVAMPEVGIGFTPDVGGLFVLSRSPGQVGTHLTLTGDRMVAADALYAGFADHFIPAARWEQALAALETTDPGAALRALSTEPDEPCELQPQREWIDACYAADRIEDILGSLAAHPDERARATAERLRSLSPTALKVSLRALRAAAGDEDVSQTLQRDLRVSARSLAGHDFPEGIRAQVIDRDRTPRWLPAELGEVTDADVEAYFADLGDRELQIPQPSSPTTKES
ncbi:enoyl-CoA hydratase/isomerase family protein [Klenkia sp. LSe6-5]|uniref:3-hydroxyisobutyryl-CoA hydrolase n=1 Tax=Klenkia sesuvii TaxID=3103137 RepID=A0ABU8DWI7_9ACTN